MFPNHHLIKSLFFLCFFLTSVCKAQLYTVAELNKKTNEYINKGDVNNAIKINLKASHDFKNKADHEGTANAYLNIGTLFWSLARYQESLQYLDKAKDELSTLKKTQLQAKLYNEYGRNYNSLELFTQSNINLNKALEYIKYLPQEHKERYLYHIYFRKWENFQHLKQYDSAYAMRNRCLKITSSSVTYSKIAEQFVKQKKNYDSADFYLMKAFAQKDYSFPYNRAIIYKISGDLNKEKNENEKALQDYSKFLLYSQKIKRKVEIREAYDRLHSIYIILGNNEKSSEFLEKYKLINDSIKQEEKKTMSFVLNTLQEENQIEEKKQKNSLLGLISVICIVIIIFVISLYVVKKRHLRRQETKDEIIEKKSLETRDLKKKINVSFNEVIELAKNNDPFFLSRFKEVYPEFYEKLISYNSSLTANEIKLSAYLRLDLSNKEIATFEKLTFRTVETKKYRLKKKLGLGSEIDLNKWMIELI